MFFLSIIFLPLLGSIFSGLFGKYLGHKGSVIISTSTVFLTFLFSLNVLYNLIKYEKNYHITIAQWISSGLFHCNWGFLFDTLTVVMLIVVTSISTLVHIYSSNYMSQDPHLSRFMSYLSLFTFFMIILVTGDNFVQMFVGWEGVGFCSYLLINFWFTRLQANKAAIKAMLVNRVSDFIFVLGLLIIFVNLKSVEYFSVFASISLLKDFTCIFFNYNLYIIDIICILLFIGAMGKSAQIFLHIWLPDAMEGPTPVSALIHAATMVTAGVYLVARCSPIFEYSILSLKFIVIIGAMTAFFASTVGLVQNDLKKIIAYSTCSQLGYMFFACGLSNYSLAVFHLSNHAFFKALLFLSAGSVIHAMSDEQDIRKMGGLKRILPFTYTMFLIGSLSLMGFPFLTGFYSKDVILEVAYASFDEIGHFAYWLGTISAMCTAFYSTRLIYFTFLSKTNSHKNVIIHAHDAPFIMALPLGILAFGSIFIGYLTKDMFIGLGTNFWNNSIYINYNNIQMIDAEFLPTYIKLLPVILSIFSLFIALFLYHLKFKFFYKIKTSNLGKLIYNFLNRKWFFDKIYYEFLSQNVLKISYDITYKIIDKGLIEILGPYGIVYVFTQWSRNLSYFQTGYIFHYSLIIFLSLILLIGVLFISIYFNIIYIFIIFIIYYFFIKK
jgi:proton-translocating NADH-quinone oxidoreductase chain L